MANPNGETLDILQENIKKLRELFPEVVTEGNIDFDKLKQILGEYVDDSKERYNFTWNGKGKALRLSQTPSLGTLRPCKEESKDWDTTQNLYIEGDNLEVLKLLQKSYHNKVKMIYIDPPYNTGGDFVYPDDFSDSIENYKKITGQVDGEGKKISSNTEANGRYHTDWLNMIYPRLRLARNLLTDDGVIFISIDDNEVSNMIKLCGEVFGENNFVGTLLWKKKTNGNNMGFLPPVHDYILCFAKNIENMSDMGYDITDEFISKTYSNTDNDPRGAWTTMDLSANHKGPYFSITNPATGESFLPPKGRYWVFNEKEIQKRIADGRIIFGKTGTSRPVQKVFASERMFGKVRAESWWDNKGKNEDATAELNELFSEPKLFTHPKPTKLLVNLIEISTHKDSIVLDFFSGSGTTAHALMLQNSIDGGCRKFIMVQLPEPCVDGTIANEAGYKNICELGKERIRRAGDKINADFGSGNIHMAIGEKKKPLDIGFKVFKLDTSNLGKWQPDYDNLEQTLMGSINNFIDGRSELDVIFEILIKMGLDLTYQVEKISIGGKKVYYVGFGALMMCLDDEITNDVAEGMVKLYKELQPETWKVVFKDNGFKSDSNKTNIKEILKFAGLEEEAFTTI